MFREKLRYGQDPKHIHRSADATFYAPLKWQREVERGERTGRDRLVFTCSWSDFFIADADPWRADAWDVIRRCPCLVFQILTKRAERIADHLPPFWDEVRDRCWLGVSVENQAAADRRVPDLLDVPAAVRFLSVEPLLGPVDLKRYLWSATIRCRCGHPFEAWQANFCEGHPGSSFIPEDRRTMKCPSCGHCVCPESVAWETREYQGTPMLSPGRGRFEFTRKGPAWSNPIGWMIVGGESGPDARPMHPRWARRLRDDCAAAGIPYFFKQWGEYEPMDDAESFSEYMTTEATDDDLREMSAGVLILHPDGRTEIPSPTYEWWTLCDAMLAPDPGADDPEFLDGPVAVHKVGKKTAGRDLDGRTWDEFPACAPA